MDILCYLNLFLTFLDKHTWLITIGTALVTVGFAIWQINRQFNNTLASQKANKLNELHLQIYKEIADKIELCELALTNTDTMVRMIPLSFERKIIEDNNARNMGLSESKDTISERYPIMAALHNEAGSKLTQVLSVMDKYEIAFADFTTIKQHISSTYMNFIYVISDFHHISMQYLPMDIKEEDRAAFGGPRL